MAIPFNRAHLHVYVITDPLLIGTRDLVDAVAEAVDGGATMVQYRDKDVPRNIKYETALRLRRLTRNCGVPFIVNDEADLALAVEADGVHLGRHDLPAAAVARFARDRLWIGVSTHDVAQAETACKDAPAYVAIGPVFPTGTKADPDPVVGLQGVRAVRAAIGDVPLVGIGGITLDNAPSVRRAGADGVSVISAVWRSSDVRSACRALHGPDPR